MTPPSPESELRPRRVPTAELNLDAKNPRLLSYGGGQRELERRLEASFALSPRGLQVVEVRTSAIVGRQTGSFTPGTRECLVELDMHAVID
jgi:hypothetical protein